LTSFFLSATELKILTHVVMMDSDPVVLYGAPVEIWTEYVYDKSTPGRLLIVMKT